MGNDVFQTSETVARGQRYGVSGIPHVMIDGVDEFIGASPCDQMIPAYRGSIDENLDAASFVSPIDIQGGLTINGSTATVTAEIELVDDVTLEPLQATLFLAEDDIFWCCGYGGADTWEKTVRMVRSTPINPTFGGGPVVVEESRDISAFNAANLHAYVVVEAIAGSKKVYQATDFTPVDYFFAAGIGTKVASAPDGNETVLFDAFVQNLGEQSDVLDVSIDNAFGWPADFQIEGDATWYTATTVSLAPGEIKAVTIRVQTDSDVRIGQGTFTATSQATAQVQSISPKVFNGSYAILVVDDDGVNTYEDAYTNALTSLGYLYEEFNVGNGGTGPTASGLRGYDAIVWQTAYLNSTLSEAEVLAVRDYLDNGGGLYLASMDFLTSQTAGNTFTSDYLGLASWQNNARADLANGVGGDPISNGMNFTFTWPASGANRADHLTLGAGTGIFTDEDTQFIAVRHQMPNGSRTVLNTAPLNVFTDAGFPNTQANLMATTMDWILGGGDPADAGELPVLTRNGLLDASPNPFRPATDLSFRLSDQAAAEPVSLVLVDAAGRQVRALVDGRLEPGSHVVSWNGRDDSGKEVAGGVYFGVLRTSEGEHSTKVVRIR